MHGTDARRIEPHGGEIVYERMPVHVPCPSCGAKMRLYCTAARVRYYDCLTPGCEATLKLTRDRPQTLR